MQACMSCGRARRARQSSGVATSLEPFLTWHVFSKPGRIDGSACPRSQGACCADEPSLRSPLSSAVARRCLSSPQCRRGTCGRYIWKHFRLNPTSAASDFWAIDGLRESVGRYFRTSNIPGGSRPAARADDYLLRAFVRRKVFSCATASNELFAGENLYRAMPCQPNEDSYRSRNRQRDRIGWRQILEP